MKIKIFILFTLFLSLNMEVIQPKKNFEDIVADFYDNLKEQKIQSRKLNDSDLAQYFFFQQKQPYYYYPKDNKGINKKFNDFTYSKKNKDFAQIYNDYLKMFNTPIARLQKIFNHELIRDDLNNNHFRELVNPNSFEYDKYYDGYNEKESMSFDINHQGFKSNNLNKGRLLSTNDKNDKKYLKNLEKQLNEIKQKKQRLLSKKNYLDQEKVFYSENFKDLYNKKVPEYLDEEKNNEII